MTVTIYHNPNCSKSRATLELIEKTNEPVRIIEYLSADLSKNEIELVVSLLKLADVREIMRTSDPLYIELDLASESVDQKSLVETIIDNPSLLQRPIVIANEKAVIGRPPENVLEIL